MSRGLYSLVDWNVLGDELGKYFNGRGLYSLVDWNPLAFFHPFLCHVEAYTASWIEIINPISSAAEQKSRGLYSLVDWNAS